MKSNIPGIHWSKRNNKWRVQISRNGIRKSVGLYASLDNAIKAKLEYEKTLPPKTCKDRIQNGRYRNQYHYKKKKCERCGETKELYLHHIIPLNWGGSFEEENCITLCKSCHMEDHKKLSKKLTLDLRNQILSQHQKEILEILNK